MAPVPSSPNDPADGRRRWAAAWALALLWHLAVLALLQWFDPFAPDGVRAAAAPAPIEFVFEPSPSVETAERSEERDPTFFSELPEDRADLRPERPDFLSNVDSRAADRVEEGEATDLPRMTGRGDSPQVAMVPSAPAEAAQEEPAPPGTPAAAGGAEARDADLPTDGVARRGLTAEADAGRARPGSGESAPGLDERAELLRRGRPPAPVEKPRFFVGVGRADLFQEEMSNPLGNVNLFADVSLNTVAWEWAPWLQRFARQFHRNWYPPYAYGLGIIDGWQLVEIEVAPDGSLLRLEVLEEHGHESLTSSTVGTFRSFAPYAPLPSGFPEPTLRLRVKVVYPVLRR